MSSTTTASALAPTSTTTEAPTHWSQVSGELTYELLATYPHDAGAFTQGLEIVSPGVVVESTGLRGESDRRLVDVTTGEVTLEAPLGDEEFGEGITMVGDEFYQLTWQAGVAIVSDATTLAETRRFEYQGEGWGLCLDERDQLVHSDGTASLEFRDTETFDVTSTVEVTVNGEPLSQLNELECVGDVVLANVWQTPQIAVIDPTTGVVRSVVNLTDLYPETVVGNSAAVLNGIAYDETDDTLLVTGKQWPVLHRIRLTAP